MEIQMPEAVVECIVLVIPYLYDAVFYPECIPVIVTHLMMVYFDNPVGEVFSVEQRYPVLFGVAVSDTCTSGKDQDARGAGKVKQTAKNTCSVMHGFVVDG